MAKTSQEIEKEFIDGLRTFTSNDLQGWLSKIKSSGITKRNDIIKWLKTDEGFGHMNASLLAGIYLNGGKPVYANEADLLANQFGKNEDMKQLFEQLQKAILKWDGTVHFVIKKTYISITKKREFAAINIKKGELRIGFDLGDMPFTAPLEKSKLTGPMPRISHMVTLKSEKDINNSLFELLNSSDKRVN